jgi:ParB/RepB/Spo0J family partition protein
MQKSSHSLALNQKENKTMQPLVPENASPQVVSDVRRPVERIAEMPSSESDGLFGPPRMWRTNLMAVAAHGQTRKTIAEDELHQLAETMREYGVLQPILVAKGQGEELVIVAGERRWRAAKLAGLLEVPVRVAMRDLGAAEHLEVQLIENSARADLPSMELAAGLHQLQRLKPRPLHELAGAVGLHPSTASRKLALLTLPASIQARIDKELSPAVAYEISKLKDDRDRLDVAAKAIDKQLSRDQVAALVASWKAGRRAGAKAPAKPLRRVTLHLPDHAMQLVIASSNDKPITLEGVTAALDAVSRKIRRLHQGGGDLADVLRVFPKPSQKQTPPTAPDGEVGNG